MTGRSPEETDRPDESRDLGANGEAARFRAIYENAPVGIKQVAADGRVVEANPALCRLLGYAREELLGLRSAEITHPDDRADDLDRAGRLLAGEVPSYTTEKRYIRKDGTHAWASVTSSAVLEPGAEPFRIAIVVEIADRRVDLEELERSRAFARRIAETSPDLLFVYDLAERRAVYVNDRVEAILGYKADAFRAMGGGLLDRLVHPDDLAAVRGAFARLESLADGESVESEGRFLHLDGSWRWLRARVGVFRRDDDGRPRQAVVHCRDVTEEKATERALVEEEAKFRSLFDSSVVPLIFWRDDGRVVEANDAFLRLTGHTRGELAAGAIRWDALTPLEYRDRDAEGLRQLREGDLAAPIEKEFRLRDGRRVPVLVGGSMLRGFDDRGFAFVIDLAAQKRAEAALRESEERFRSLTQAIPQLVWACRPDGHADFFNRQWSEYTGQALEDARGDGWMEALHPDDVARVEDAWRAAVASGTLYQIEYRLRRADGAYRWHLARGWPQPGLAGGVALWIGTSTDVDDRVRDERALREADRRKTEFLAMLAHELRNPLAAIGSAAKLLDRAGDDPTRAWSRAVIASQVSHLTRLIDDLVDASRITRGAVELRTERVDAAEVVRRAVETARPMIVERGHRLEVALADGLAVDVDPTRIEQVVVNLLSNAARYTDPGGSIRLEAARDGADVAIRVADDGIGIRPEDLPAMFGLFAQGDRSSARSEGGLGIGLTIVKTIVELHGGAVSGHSDGPGLGSTFTVRLPASPAPAPAPSPRPTARGGGPSRRLLIVDDNAQVAEAVARFARLTGHEAKVVHNGPDALEAAPDFRPDLILLDIGLPGMDGHEVAARLRSRRDLDGVPIVAVTGYGQEEDRRRSREAGFDHHFVKPYDLDDIFAALGWRA